jgi:hypothetical protein
VAAYKDVFERSGIVQALAEVQLATIKAIETAYRERPGEPPLKNQTPDINRGILRAE